MSDTCWACLATDVLPAIGNQMIGDITAPTIFAVIRQVEARCALDISR
jgi:hypothetical protein